MKTNVPPVIVKCIEEGIKALRFKACFKMNMWNACINNDPKNVNSDYAIETNKQIEDCYTASQILEKFLEGIENHESK